MSSKKLGTESATSSSNSNSKHSRYFSEEFKRTKVKEIVEKRISISEFCKLYDVSRTSVYKWIYKYSALEKGTRQVIEMESEAQKTKLLQEKVSNLERKLGQKQLEIDYLSKVLELASEELGYDLKKKYEQRL
jgi:transposase